MAIEPLPRRFYDTISTPKSQLWLESEGQIDFYDEPRLIGPAADAIAEHFKTRWLSISDRI